MRLAEGAAETAPVAQVALDRDGVLAFANDAARKLFALGGGDLGRPIQDLELSYRPVELRAPVQEALEHRRRVPLGRVQYARGGTSYTLDIEVCPLQAAGAEPLGVTVSFTDVSELAQLDQLFEDSKRQLATAYEELQSTVEELETTNEELQSTNEELETMNEELQSTNDELEVMNEQQRERSDEVDRLNLFLEGILGGLGMVVVVLDTEQAVQVWNESATDMWGLRPEEVLGRNFLALDIGLPFDRLRTAIRSALGDESRPSTLVVDAVNRRGKAFECRVRVLPLTNRAEAPYGVILLMAVDGRLAPDGQAVTAEPSQSPESSA